MGRKKVVYVQQQPQQNNSGCGSSILALLVLGGIASAFGGGDNDTDEGRNTPTTESTTTEYVEELSNEEQFIKDFAEYQSKDIIEDIYDIYINKIGFEEVEFKEQLDNTLNYEITADGFTTVVTVIDNDDYRIFIPDSSMVFYENGEVLKTKTDLENILIDDYQKITYYSIAKEIVESALLSPKSADFPSQSKIQFQRQGDLVAVKGYVDADNAFGAEIRNEWLVQFYIIDYDNYIYELVYINLGGETSGEWVDFEE